MVVLYLKVQYTATKTNKKIKKKKNVYRTKQNKTTRSSNHVDVFTTIGEEKENKRSGNIN